MVRLGLAITGDLFFIAPMLIMSLGVESKQENLITVCISIHLFTRTIAFGMKVSNLEAMVATATYASVLAVFVGITATA